MESFFKFFDLKTVDFVGKYQEIGTFIASKQRHSKEIDIRVGRSFQELGVQE